MRGTWNGYPEPVSGPGIDPKDLRVSDGERAHVLALLEKATGRGLIDLAEFSDRSATVVAARTRGELNAVLLDLPGLVIAGRTVAQAGQQASADPAPSFPLGPGRSVPALQLTGWGSRDFKGYWVAPARIVIGGPVASTRLNFTSAQLTSRDVTIEFQNNAYGSVELIVPDGSAVRFDGLQMRSGGVDNRVRPGFGSGVLNLTLTGVKRGGSVLIRYPRRGLFGGRG